MLQKTILAAGVTFFLFLANALFAEASLLMNLKSAAIVLGGTLVSALLAYPFETFRGLLASLQQVFQRPRTDLDGLIQRIKELARIRRMYGPRELGEEAQRVEPLFLRKGIELIVDEYDRFEIAGIMEKEYELYFACRQSQINILSTLAKLAPAFGFVGTIIGLLNVLNHLGAPAQIGRGMSLALLTTLYGLLLANLLFLPLAKKLSEQTQHDTLVLYIILEGVLDVCEAKNPWAIAHRLKSYSGITQLHSPEGFRAPEARPAPWRMVFNRIAARRGNG